MINLLEYGNNYQSNLLKSCRLQVPDERNIIVTLSDHQKPLVVSYLSATLLYLDSPLDKTI